MKKTTKYLLRIVIYVLFIVVFVGAAFFSLFVTKWIVESDMPEWLKLWLIAGGR